MKEGVTEIAVASVWEVRYKTNVPQFLVSQTGYQLMVIDNQFCLPEIMIE
jgi:hypothetical protein